MGQSKEKLPMVTLTVGTLTPQKLEDKERCLPWAVEWKVLYCRKDFLLGIVLVF